MSTKFCQSCGMELMPSMRICPSCGSNKFSLDKVELSKSTENNSHQSVSASSSNLKGLRGWLVLLGFGLVFGVIRLIIELINLYKPYINTNLFDILANPASEKYISNFKFLFYFEIIYNVFLILFMIYTIYLFFTCSKKFPPRLIFILLVHLVYYPLDAIAASIVIPNQSAFDAATMKDLFKSVVYAAVWIPYLIKSERVKNTFVND